ncbi:hypothetical protein JK159_00285 [Weissella minor]|uniref:hypothetical protein n=1 Tax=Weissella minor TaxID=1620 RepID=UPI001BAF7B48|nr:hypothetical protein [Weissella minor]MBS0948827.1 hypothetical protein [Weissella minor]
MYNSARGSFLRATPGQICFSLIIDTLMYLFFNMLFDPMDSTTLVIYLIFFPGIDFFSLVVSFYHYVKEHREGQKKK